MRIAVTGASGFVGGALLRALRADDHQVLALVRRPAGPDEIAWDPASGRLDANALEGLDVVVHLAGESIAGARWTAARKARIRQSRVAGTSLLARTLAGLRQRPAVLVSASAIGLYGNRGDEVLTESSGPGEGFLAEVVVAWEAATAPAADAGIRVVLPRFGMILDPAGGALAQMLPPFRLAAGGPMGSGRQWTSWVTLADVVAVLQFAIATPALAGPVNTVAPAPVRNAAFARALGEALHRPAVVPAPAFALRLLFGEMADEMLLAGQRCLPTVLDRAGYRFHHPDLLPALRAVLAQPATDPA